MPKKKTDSTILAEIREVISDMQSGFEVRCYKSHELLEKGQLDRLGDGLAIGIIEDLLTGKASALTKDYRKTKADAAKAARASASPAP